MEENISMPELTAILSAKREEEYNARKFDAALNGVDLDAESGKSESDPWEDMKARVFSGGKATDANDIVSLQGINAQQAGFGIGAGLEYADGNSLENPFG